MAVLVSRAVRLIVALLCASVGLGISLTVSAAAAPAHASGPSSVAATPSPSRAVTAVKTSAAKVAKKQKTAKKNAAKRAKTKRAKAKRAKARKRAAARAKSQAKARAQVPVTVHQMPFVCGQQWTGSTRSYHSPSANSVDFNAPDDLGAPVIASAPGRVITSNNTSNSGYGRYVVLDHGKGETTVYAHLQYAHVTVGTWLDQGSLVGQLGTTGNSSGPHLHFEEKVGRTVVAPWLNRMKYGYGTSASTNCADVPLGGNLLEGEGAEVAVFRRSATPQVHVWSASESRTRTMMVGQAFDEPILGDWDGDGLQAVGAFNPVNRQFTIAGEAGFRTIVFGERGDRPIAGDWDGDGRWEVGVHTPSTNTFKLRGATGAVTTISFGKAGGIPVTGDWDGDGLTDIGLFDRVTATFTLRTRAARPVVSTVVHGAPGDIAVTGDWDGNGITDVGTWSPSTATFNQRIVPAGTTLATFRTIRYGRAR